MTINKTALSKTVKPFATAQPFNRKFYGIIHPADARVSIEIEEKQLEEIRELYENLLLEQTE